MITSKIVLNSEKSIFSFIVATVKSSGYTLYSHLSLDAYNCVFCCCRWIFYGFIFILFYFMRDVSPFQIGQGHSSKKLHIQGRFRPACPQHAPLPNALFH